MATISRFEDLESWKNARVLTRRIYEVTAQGSFSRDFGLRDQIRRAATSIMANIAEGFERDGNQEFRQFLSVAKGSAGEVRSHLYTALDVGLLSQPDFDELALLTEQIGRQLGAFSRYLQSSAVRGAKFK